METQGLMRHKRIKNLIVGGFFEPLLKFFSDNENKINEMRDEIIKYIDLILVAANVGVFVR